MAKSTPEQIFAKIFRTWMHPSTQEEERRQAERKADVWLTRRNKTRADIPAILVQARKDDEADEAQKSSSPPPDPRDSAPHPFDDAAFTPAGVVNSLINKYVTMEPHARAVFSLWICFSHVYERFSIAPRLALTSEDPGSGKSTAAKVARRLVFRPNSESLGTGAAIADFLDQGPGTILLDELDQVDADGRRRLRLIWNLGYEAGASYGMMIRGRHKIVNLHAPVLAAGLGGFLATTQRSRTYVLEMKPYDAGNRPECEFTTATEQDFGAFDTIYAYLRNWSRTVQLNPRPDVAGLIRRDADNARGLISVADACGPEWAHRARAAIKILVEKEQAENPKITIVRHGLAIFDGMGIEQITSIEFNRELKRLDLPDARWTRYRGASNTDFPHPITVDEQAALLKKAEITSTRIRFAIGRQRRQRHGYQRTQFEEALRNNKPESHGLRLIASSE